MENFGKGICHHKLIKINGGIRRMTYDCSYVRSNVLPETYTSLDTLLLDTPWMASHKDKYKHGHTPQHM